MPQATIDPALAPQHGLLTLRALEDAGHEAWVVGGWVRDALRGVVAHDVDVCTSAPWPQSKVALEAAGFVVHETGTAHGTVTAVVCGEPVEVTTYRIDGAYTDQRHPDSVTFVIDVREDLARRDFTVNAMAWHNPWASRPLWRGKGRCRGRHPRGGRPRRALRRGRPAHPARGALRGPP